MRSFSQRGCSIPPRAICSRTARQQPARLLLHLAAADLTGHGRSAQRRCLRLERCDASGVRFGRRTAIRCVRWLDLCFFGCCTTISSFLGLHGYGHPSPQVGLATSVFKPLTNCTSFPDTTFWTVSAQSLPFLYGHLSPRVGLATSVLKPLTNCTRFPDTLFQTVSGSPLPAGCTQARPFVVIPWLFGCLAGGDGVELCAYGFRGRGVDTGCSQQALGAAARLAHRRGQRGVQATEAAGEARSVRLSIPGTTRRSCPRRPMRCLPQSPEQPEVRVPMLLVAE